MCGHLFTCSLLLQVWQIDSWGRPCGVPNAIAGSGRPLGYDLESHPRSHLVWNRFGVLAQLMAASARSSCSRTQTNSGASPRIMPCMAA